MIKMHAIYNPLLIIIVLAVRSANTICSLPLEVRVASIGDFYGPASGLWMMGHEYGNNNLLAKDKIVSTSNDRMLNFTLWMGDMNSSAVFQIINYSGSNVGFMAAIYYNGVLLTQTGQPGWNITTTSNTDMDAAGYYTFVPGPNWTPALSCSTPPATVNVWNQSYVDFVTKSNTSAPQPQWIAPNGNCNSVVAPYKYFVRVNYTSSTAGVLTCPYNTSYPSLYTINRFFPQLEYKLGDQLGPKQLHLRLSADQDYVAYIGNYTFVSEPDYLVAYSRSRTTNYKLKVDTSPVVFAAQVYDGDGARSMTASIVYDSKIVTVTGDLVGWKATDNSALVRSGWNWDYNYDTTGWADLTEAHNCANQVNDYAVVQPYVSDLGACAQLVGYPNCSVGVYGSKTTMYFRYRFDPQTFVAKPLSVCKTVDTSPCAAGTYKNSNNMVCYGCALGTYKYSAGNAACSTCPVGMTTNVTGSTTCMCAAGYEWNGSACSACAANMFKTSISNGTCSSCANPSFASCTTSTFTCNLGHSLSADGQSCTQCPQGTYKNTTGNSSLCTSCGFASNTVSAASTSFANCSCLAGYGWDGSSCSACPANYYKASAGNVACLACPANSTCNAISFTCSAGYTLSGDGLSCVPCALGYFKPGAGNGVCTQCDPGASTAAVASVAAGSCQCMSGYGWNGVSCLVCPSGLYKSGAGNSACISCPANSVCTTSTFTCNAGYTLSGDGLSCVPCDQGSYKNVSGNGLCTSCGLGSTTATTASTNVTSCTCVAGYRGTTGTDCSACPVSYYKAGDGNWDCLYCPYGASCNSTSFSCDLGYTAGGDGLSCTQCAQGFFKNVTGNSACLACNSGATTATAGSVVASSCQCRIGYGWDSASASCTACAANTYKPTLSNTACTPCPSNAVCSSSAFICNAGYTVSADGQSCVACPLGTYKDTAGNSACSSCAYGATTAATASVLASTCLCVDGYGWSGSGCGQCGANYFKYGLSNAPCAVCPQNSVCNSTSFQCAPGYVISADQQSCTACPIGTYKSAAGNSTCTSCPLIWSTEAAGTTSASGCMCPAGYSWDGVRCIVCPAGTYKSATGNYACSDCPTGSISLTNTTTSVDGCVCLPGYEWDGFSCRPCASGKVKTDTGNVACISCPRNAVCSSTVIRCAVNYTPSADGWLCVQCASGNYKDSLSNELCKPCPVGSGNPQCAASGGAVESTAPADNGQQGISANSNAAAVTSDSSVISTQLIIILAVAISALLILLVVVILKCSPRKSSKKSFVAADAPSLKGTVRMPFADDMGDLTRTSLQSTAYFSRSYANPGNTTLLSNNTEFAMPGFLQLQAGRDFRWETPLAKGGGGEVYLGHGFTHEMCAQNGGVIVVKIVAPSRTAISMKASLAFDQEIAVMHFLGRHRNIVQMLGWCEEPLAIVMKYYKLGTLRSFIGSGYLTTKAQMLLFAKDICVALLFMHGKCVAHRDIKSDNVLIDLDVDGGAVCVLGDFGIANIFSKNAELVEGFRVANVNGLTITYSAPEVIQRFHNRQVELTMEDAFRGDMFSTAALLYLLLTKVEPWSAK